MKNAWCFFALLLISLMGCSSTKTSQSKPQAQNRKDAPETVMVTYHVKPGMELVLNDVLSRAWVLYRKEHLVFAEPHTIIEAGDEGGGSRIIEIFTWVNHTAPEHVSPSVKELWGQMQGLCQPRNGRGGLEGGEVGLLEPKR